MSRPPPDVAEALAMAERAGFRLMLIGRSAVLTLLVGWTAATAWRTANPIGPLVASALLALGLAVLASLGTERERRWHRHAVVAADIAAMAGAAIFAPLLAGEDVPQALVFRVYGLHFLWIPLVVSALALSPGLTAFAGAAAAAAIGAVYVGVTWELTAVRSWSEIGPDATAADYLGLITDPAFVAPETRIEEAAALLACGLLLALAVARARRLVIAHAAETARRRRVEDAFGRHVPEAVAARLAEAPETLAPSLHDATALHLDAEGFTAFAAGRAPTEVLETLDRLLADAAEAIAAHGGVVVSFGGDSVLATFGAPLAQADHAARALAAARAILAASARHPLPVRIGLASGRVAAGVVGGRARQAFTVYGEVVNLAQRLEQAGKAEGRRLMVAAETAALVGPQAGLAALPPLALPGLTGPVTAYGEHHPPG